MLKSFLQIHPLLDSAAGIPTHNFKKYRDLSNHLQKKKLWYFPIDMVGRYVRSFLDLLKSLIHWDPLRPPQKDGWKGKNFIH